MTAPRVVVVEQVLYFFAGRRVGYPINPSVLKGA